mgnify:FL=1
MMLLSQISPFVRFPRELVISESSVFGYVFPVDARLFYVSEGEGRITVSGNTVILPRGSALLINSGVKYRIIPSNVVYSAINFDWTQKFSNFSTPISPIPFDGGIHSALESISFEDCPSFNSCAFCKNVYFAEKVIKQIIDRYEKKQAYYQLEANAELVIILTEIARRLGSQKDKRFNAAEIADYLQKHYKEDISNATVANAFHFHPNYISSEFKAEFGIPLHRYLSELRITKAIGLLETGQYSIERVSEEVGFNDPNYFSRYFKRITGKTPNSFYR